MISVWFKSTGGESLYWRKTTNSCVFDKSFVGFTCNSCLNQFNWRVVKKNCRNAQAVLIREVLLPEYYLESV